MAQDPTQKIEQAHQLARPARKRLLDFLRRPSTRQRRFGDRGSPAGGRRAPESAGVGMATGINPTGSDHPYPYPLGLNFTRRVTRTRIRVRK